MASTKFAVIYSKATGRIRWELQPDDDSELVGFTPNHSGEAVLILDNSEHTLLPDLQTKISTACGITPINDRYAVVTSTNQVASIVIADPLCGDTIAGHTMIASQTAGVGDIYNPSTKTFTPKVST